MSVIIATGRDLPAAIREPRLKRLYDYWCAARRERRFPSRRDIDPLDFPYVLGSLMLVDVVREPLRFWVRLHGTEMVARAHYDLTGKFLDELPISEFRDYTIMRCRELVEGPQPLWVQHDRELDDRRYRYQALWLPFSDDDATVAMLMCALIYEPSGMPLPRL
jgi:hypothetical protein